MYPRNVEHLDVCGDYRSLLGKMILVEHDKYTSYTKIRFDAQG